MGENLFFQKISFPPSPLSTKNIINKFSLHLLLRKTQKSDKKTKRVVDISAQSVFARENFVRGSGRERIDKRSARVVN